MVLGSATSSVCVRCFRLVRSARFLPGGLMYLKGSDSAKS